MESKHNRCQVQRAQKIGPPPP